MLSKIPERWWLLLWKGLIAVASGVLIFSLARHFLFELNGAFNDDTPVYWAVGRGMVNGLRIYTDLLEIKPPGIFLVGALSYALTDTMIIGHLIQGLVIVLLPLTVIVPFLRLSPGSMTVRWLSTLALVIGFGGCLALYSALRSGAFQTESFGAVFACAYAGTIFLLRERRSRMLTVLSGFFFFGGILFKEPFAIGMVAAGLLVCREWRDIVRLVIVPAVIGGIFFLLTLLILGALDPYFTVYLPFMTGERTQRWGSPFSRAALLEMTWTNLWTFSPFFALSVIALWIAFAAWTARMHLPGNPRRWILFLLLLASVPLIAYGYQTIRIPPSAEGYAIAKNPLLVTAGVIALLGSVYALVRPWTDQWWMATRIFFAVLMVACTGYTAGLSGEFVGHHFIFILPAYTALALCIVLDVSREEGRLWSRIISGIALLAIAAALFNTKMDYVAQAAWQKESWDRETVLAKQVDAVMDACGYSQYLIMNEIGSNVFGFTKHSPLGPIFFQHSLATGYIQFARMYVDELQKADLILTKWNVGRPHLPGVYDYVKNDFTETPPACAGTSFHQPEDGFRLLFRLRRTPFQIQFQ